MEKTSKHKADFPAFNENSGKQDFTYLDTAASAQKPQSVIDTVKSEYERNYANIHRGLYKASQEKTNKYETVRNKIAGFINAKSDKEIVFTKNATEAINLVASSWGAQHLQKNDEVIVTEMEHHANMVPWQMICDKKGAVLRVIPVSDNGELVLSALDNLLSEKTKLVAVTQISNVLGTVNPVCEISKTVKDYNSNIKLLVDGSQGIVHGGCDVQSLRCDFYVFTGHKLYAPAGVGVLWAKYEILEQMPPYQGGGDMIEKVSLANGNIYAPPPARFEAGTPDFISVIGLGAAVDYLQSIEGGMNTIVRNEEKLTAYAIDALENIDGLQIHGRAGNRAGIISFTADWAHISDISMILDNCGVCLRSGHHCCMPLMERLGVEGGTLRASFGLYTDENDIDKLVDALGKARDMLS